MRPPRRMAGPWTAAAGTSGIPDSGGVAHGPGRRPLVRGGVMHAPPRRRGADGLRGEVNPLQAVCGGARRQAATDACRVRAMRRISPSCRQARSCRVLPRRNGGTRTRGLAAPSRARCRLRHIPFARRPGLEPGSTVLETAVLAIAPPTQREASTAPCAPPPGPPDGRRDRRLPRAPSRIRTGDLPLTRRLRYHWAIGALTVPPIAFSNA